MRTFKAYFKKEILESIRQHRYLILAAGFILFAIMDPLMLKMLPYFIKNQIPAEMWGMLTYNPVQVAQSYMKAIFQLGNLFVILSLMSVYSEEIHQNRLVFPYTKGARVEGMVLARIFHYSLTILVVSVLSFLLNTYYIHLLFGEVGLAYMDMIRVSLLFAVYYIFTLSLLFYLSSLTPKGVVAGIIVLLVNYTGPLFLQIPALKGWWPHSLIVQANQLGAFDGTVVTKSLVGVLITVIILQWLTVRQLKRVEVV